MKLCKKCKKEFNIRKEDKIFYEQINVPEPKLCPDCRMQERLSFRNERTLYKRKCDLCQKDGVSLYAEGTPFPVYCQKCWWGDGWDPRDYAQDYDPKRPFFEQLQELKNKVPRIALLVIDCINCEYTNNTGECKNCYLIFAAENNEDCMYGRLIQRCKSSVDCAFLYDSELCYECVDCRELYSCMFCEKCQSSTDLMFCFDMRDSNNCLFCTNGRHMSNSIFNKKYSQEEFQAKKKEILSSYEKLKEAKQQFEELKKNAIVKYAEQTKCHNASGDYMFNCHDGVRIFDASNGKNSSYVADAEDPLDCHDCNNLYFKPERLYGIMGTLQSTKCINGVYIMYGNEVDYSDSCYNCTSCFGSVGLNKINYCILNKEYSKEDYQKIKNKIVEKMRKEGIYGDFLPPSLSPFGYNETLAQEYYPLTKEEAEAKGFNWQDKTTGTYGKETIKKGEIPNTIDEVDESILKEILVCEDCEKNFRITKSELDFYKRMGLPLPRQDFECRHKNRMRKRNPRALWHRKCMCENANHEHPSSGGNVCTNEFETSYSPDRPERVYCENCYQQAVY